MMLKFRLTLASLAAVAMILVGITQATVANAGTTYSDPAGKIISLTNDLRSSKGLNTLKRSQALDAVAYAWAKELAAKYEAALKKDPNASVPLSHNPYTGTQIPSGWTAWGENVAWNRGYSDPVVQMQKQWVNSPSHYENLVKSRFKYMGVGYYVDKYGVSWGVQVFGDYKSDSAAGVKTTSTAAANAKASGFVDVSAKQPFIDEIKWLANEGVSEGWQVSNGYAFRPTASVNRDVMAAFLYRFAGEPRYTPPAKSPFKDVSTSHVFYKEIAWLAEQDITNGWKVPGGYEFRPTESVNRDVMAAFLYRFAGEPTYTPPAKSPFKDVPTSHVFYKEIAWLASTGVSEGWSVSGGSEFRTVIDVKRDVMAAFLYRYNGAVL